LPDCKNDSFLFEVLYQVGISILVFYCAMLPSSFSAVFFGPFWLCYSALLIEDFISKQFIEEEASATMLIGIFSVS
jgi:hypothetical protein